MNEDYLDIEQMLSQALGSDDQTKMRKVMTELMNGRLRPLPPISDYKKALDPTLHDVMDQQKRPNKMINIDPDSPDYGNTRSVNINNQDGIPEKHRIEEVARIAIALQKLIVKRSVGITFGNRVKYPSVRETDQEKKLYDAIMRILKDNKEDTLNRQVAHQVYGFTEVAECWYTVEVNEGHKNYTDKETKYKVKVRVFSPELGDTLYPYFNEDMDMTAFSRMYTKKMSDGTKYTFLETYTAENYYLWKASGDKTTATTENAWELVQGYPKENVDKYLALFEGESIRKDPCNLRQPKGTGLCHRTVRDRQNGEAPVKLRRHQRLPFFPKDRSEGKCRGLLQERRGRWCARAFGRRSGGKLPRMEPGS